jgi:hypothetical protein
VDAWSQVGLGLDTREWSGSLSCWELGGGTKNNVGGVRYTNADVEGLF